MRALMKVVASSESIQPAIPRGAATFMNFEVNAASISGSPI